ncbi:AAA family ATPase [Pseudanabaena galeata UHCC 0370]|uniref:AAA family ATPase n=1 Tax=Pseudanabaena galeata UHCC 0370 TaxID=3110310 RepID=A0ABU5TPJ5_9CYAN|nr:AAA family ATPase [Pseudanabaena galeata]MEA5480194.1 AAA family ATPase [Pseudanabaena galeata UHCC 0370]
MKLLKVHVHNYRHLKDVSLTFEPDLYPQVFAIGSENGGGKSTLLQLIFTLLHCAPHPNLHKFVTNAIQHMKGSLEGWEKKIHQVIDVNLIDKDGKNISISYSLYPESLQVPDSIENLSISDAISLIFQAKSLEDEMVSLDLVKKQYEISLKELSRPTFGKNDINRKVKIQLDLKTVKEEIADIQDELLSIPQDTCYQILAKENLHLLFDVDLPSDGVMFEYYLCYRIQNNSHLNENDILDNLSKQIFLAGQTTQPYIFLSNENIGDMFNSDKNYELTLEKARLEIGNLYNFNAFAVNEIIAAFKTAIDEDAKSMIQNGFYGSSFSDLAKELKFILGGNKEILPTPKCDGLTIRYYLDDKNYKELSLGELSHGELKRVCLYSWIRHNKATNSIVLIDEIENGLHPDWQYQIVKDLQEWGDNQYILATHSFYLCEALTPRHVKELSSKMSQPILNK